MATASDDIVEKFQKFCEISGSKDHCQMTSKACGKLAADCLEKDYKKYDVKSIVDASVFPAMKEKGKPHMVVSKATCDKFIEKTAHEIAKRKTKNTKIAADDAECVKIKEDICRCISSSDPKVHATKESKTGNVKGMTDTSKYTGAHKERFDKEGKGKGRGGREDLHEHTGYVGNYKDAGTFDKKTKK